MDKNDLPALIDCVDEASSGDECDYADIDSQDEADYVTREVKGLFTDKVFSNVKELFRHEAQENQFNLIDVVTRYDLDMISYIKMINFIRSEKPALSAFSAKYADESQMPWSNDKFMKTVVEDDAALQFDVEEDLDTLEIEFDQNNNVKKAENETMRLYKKKIAESESKVGELTEMVKKLRWFI